MTRKGEIQSPEHTRKRVESRKKNSNSWISKDTRDKISRTLLNNPNNGKYKRSNQQRNNIGLKRKYETQWWSIFGLNREKNERSLQKKNKGIGSGNYIRTEKTKMKMRNSAFEYVKQTCNIICPRIGKNEKYYLDKLEQDLKIKILRQYKIEGYFLDGYIPELNLAIEIDEMPKIKEKDILRQKLIEEKLNCKFIRIKDYD